MSERAPQLLFDDGSRAIQQTSSLALSPSEPTTAVSARGSIPISTYYELDRIAAEILQKIKEKKSLKKSSDCEVADPWFARVALQFPDELLCDSPEVCWEMEDALSRQFKKEQPSKNQQMCLVFCLGDTTFGPCCPDEVAALHLNADVLVHYGHACLSHPALSLPVVYGFGVTEHWDTETCVDAILEQSTSEGVRRILLLYQVRYQHAVEDLQTQLSERGDMFLVSGQIPHEPLEKFVSQNNQELESKPCCQGSKGCGSNENQESEIGEANAEAKEPDAAQSQGSEEKAEQEKPTQSTSQTFLLGGLEVPKHLDFASFVLVFIGDDPADGTWQGKAREGQRQYMNTILWYLSTKSQPQSMWTYSPLSKKLQTSIPNGIQRQLNRRFFLINKARDASIFGILVGTLSQRHFRSVVSTLRKVIDGKGRSSYTFAMGKVNPAKVANFAEIECFIMVACAETSWLDEAEQREMHIPIITPLELHMALGQGGPEVQWGECDYSLDYSDFLAKYTSEVGSIHQTNSNSQDEGDEDDTPYFSMITGKYESSQKGKASKSVDLIALPGKGQLTTYKSEAAAFLKSREYKGLETKIGETKVHAAVPGQQGIASKYNNDFQNC